MAIEIRNMLTEDEAYIGTCTHAGESDEIDREGARRVIWLRSMEAQGLRTWVALADGQRTGFAYAMPIELCPWGPLASGLMALPCLLVRPVNGRGVGRALVQAAEEEAHRQGLHGLATVGYFHDFWLFPAPFYEKCGFQVLARQDTAALLWKPFDAQAQAPRFPAPQYTYAPAHGKVVIDLFWNIFCSTSDIEAQRVREVAAEFGDAVVLRECDAGDPAVFQRHQISRAIYVNGQEIFWGGEAPRESIREAIEKALADG